MRDLVKPSKMGAASTQNRGPILYRRPVPVSLDRFSSSKVGGGDNFFFATATDSVPLTVAEFAESCRSLPIVFLNDETSLPVAVLGVNGKNSLVGKNGNWSTSGYMPDYVRRYPIILAHDAAYDIYTLYIDEEFEGLNSEKGEPLFMDGRPSPFTATAAEFCRQYQARHRQTEEFVAAMEEHDLLRTSQAIYFQADGTQKVVASFKVIDRDRWAAIDDAGIISLRKAGWLEPAICHLISLANWPVVAGGACRATSHGMS